MNPSDFPTHECCLTLSHNENRAFYQTVQEHYEDEVCGPDWVSEEQRQKAYATNEVWQLQWYPKTPVSSYIVAACDLDVLLAHCKGK